MTSHPPAFIAVVDDDHSVLRSLEQLLESADHTVRLFASGTALLDSGCVADIDCLITDIGMPVMDGLELVRAVRATRPKLPIILITGRSELLQSPFRGLSDNRLFRKPFDGQELLEAISEVVPKQPLSPPS